MATIRAYTTIEQSNRLAEILPLESADMIFDGVGYELGIPKVKPCGYVKSPNTLPCWSCAALVSVLPRFIEYKGEKYYLGFMKEYVEYANDEVSITGRCLHTTGNDNLVDACYEMILKLHELNLL